MFVNVFLADVLFEDGEHIAIEFREKSPRRGIGIDNACDSEPLYDEAKVLDTQICGIESLQTKVYRGKSEHFKKTDQKISCAMEVRGLFIGEGNFNGGHYRLLLPESWFIDKLEISRIRANKKSPPLAYDIKEIGRHQLIDISLASPSPTISFRINCDLVPAPLHLNNPDDGNQRNFFMLPSHTFRLSTDDIMNFVSTIRNPQCEIPSLNYAPKLQVRNNFVYWGNSEVPLVGEANNILVKLVGRVGSTIPHNELLCDALPGQAQNASLRNSIALIKRVLKKQSIPYKIENRRGEGYILQSQ